MPDFCYRFTIIGRPRSKKNNKKIITRHTPGKGFRPMLVSSDEYICWEASAIAQLKLQRGRTPTIPHKVQVFAKAIIYQDKGQAIDTTNGIEGAWDALEKAGVLENDYQIARADIERKRDRENPRIEIELTPSIRKATMGKKIIQQDAWEAKARELFGYDKAGWRFICPACNNVASVELARERWPETRGKGWSPPEECVGRFTGSVDCDWTAYGFLCGPLFITANSSGEAIPVFDFDGRPYTAGGE